ncbi:MAG: type IX secretion system anionic LPS delivery protein PorZ [Chitinophagaceae bacterium]
MFKGFFWISPIFWILIPSRAFSQQQPIGQWQEHLSYANEIAVTSGDGKIFCASVYSIFAVDLQDHSLTRYSKVNGLSDVGISTIGFDPQTKSLLIAYSNSDLDILQGQNITNIPDIKMKNIIGDKTMYGIWFQHGEAYLSTGLGIIVVDLLQAKILDTYIISSTGQPEQISGFTGSGNYFYAATAEGVRQAAQDNPNLDNFANWTTLSNGWGGGAAQNIISDDSLVIALRDDSLFSWKDSLWSPFYADGWPVTNINVSGGNILVGERNPSANTGRVVELNPDGSVNRVLEQGHAIEFPEQAILQGQEVWIADLYRGLVHVSSKGFESLEPNAPNAPPVGDMVIGYHGLWAAGGTVNEAWNYTYNTNGFFNLNNNYWTAYNRFTEPYLDSVYDFITMAINPQDHTVYAGSFGGGLLQLNPDGSHVLYKQQSALEPAIGDSNSYRISGLDFDQQGNLWISSFGAPHELVVKKRDGTWKSFTIPLYHTDHAVSQVLVDSYNQKWIVSPMGNGLIVFNQGKSIDDLTGDQWAMLREGVGSGNLPDNNVRCIAMDQDGFIWVGTDNGIGILPCTGQVFPSGCDAILPVVQTGNFAGYLFQHEQVNTIAVDGANRKWVGTNQGAWLISPQGDSIIYHFTEDNSPLLSNDVRRIAVDPNSGVVYFATFNGIISFRSTATQGGTTNSQVLVFPNPIPPGYSGTIAIRGLVDNALVKITDISGKLVDATRSLGGQAVWNGEDYTGHRPQSGVYLVFVIDDTGTQKFVAKMLFIH